MGRPSKYTPETVERILDGIRSGLTYELAAGYGGVAYETFNEWRIKKPQFLQAVSEAEAEGAKVIMDRITDEAKAADWRAGAWIMEHRHGYAKTVRGEFSGPDGAPIPISGIMLPLPDEAPE